MKNKMLTKQDRKLMGRVIKWSDEIGAIAGPFLPTDTKESWLNRAARKCEVSLRHIKSLYYGHVTDPKHSVAEKIFSAADLARIEQAKRNVEMVSEFCRSQAARLEAIDPDFHREQIDRLLSAADRFGARDSAGN